MVQAAGASMASGDDVPRDQVMRGLHIYMGGVGLQQVFIIAFSVLLWRFQQHYKNSAPYSTSTTRLVLQLVYVLYAVLVLITIRIIFRLVEYSQGLDSGIPTKEAYTFVLESLPMFVAVLLLNIVHPGRVMPGSESNLPGRKQRKRMIAEGLLPGKGGSRKERDFERLASDDAELGMVDHAHIPSAS